MSKLSHSTKQVVKKFISKGMRGLEIFPGSDSDSIDYLFHLSHKKLVAIGTEDLKTDHVDYRHQRVPPYPKFFRNFDYVFLQEAEWLLVADFPSQQVGFTKNPKKVLKFIHSNLKKNGLFIISKIHKPVAERIHKWLKHYGTYDLEYEHNVVIFKKN